MSLERVMEKINFYYKWHPTIAVYDPDGHLMSERNFYIKYPKYNLKYFSDDELNPEIYVVDENESCIANFIVVSDVFWTNIYPTIEEYAMEELDTEWDENGLLTFHSGIGLEEFISTGEAMYNRANGMYIFMTDNQLEIKNWYCYLTEEEVNECRRQKEEKGGHWEQYISKEKEIIWLPAIMNLGKWCEAYYKGIWEDVDTYEEY